MVIGCQTSGREEAWGMEQRAWGEKREVGSRKSEVGKNEEGRLDERMIGRLDGGSRKSAWIINLDT
jgi:hypothetical protein